MRQSSKSLSAAGGTSRENADRAPATAIPGVPIPVSRIFLGTAMKPFLEGQDTSELLDGMFALGINAFDCARGYGLAERSLGNWIRLRNNRDKVVILTKCGNVDLSGRVRVDPEVIGKELDESLRTLNVDTVDIFLLHRDDPNIPVSETVACLNEKQREGKIRLFGVSNWTTKRIAEANAWAAAHGLNGFTVSSPNYGLAVQVTDPWGGDCVSISGHENRDARDWYAREKMPVLAYSAMGRGFFSGRFRSGDYDKAAEILDRYAQKGYLYPVNMERLARCEELAAKRGCGVPDIAMRYIFSSPMTVFAVVSTLSPERMKANIAASLDPLTPEEAAFLENGVPLK